MGRPCGGPFYHNPEQHPNLSKDELDFIKQDNEPPAVKLPFLTALKTVSKNKRFYGIAIPAFMAEPAWPVLSFWVPLYLAKEHGMDLKQIAMFGLATVPGRRSRQRSEWLPDASVYPLVRLLPR
ncbi:glucarate transporter [Citrobacter amalonaticus]|nr:glucarate transporter [Citrobacter amalonaticus]